MTLASPASWVMVPTVALEMSALGRPRFTVLKTLNRSQRTVTFELFPVLKRFCSDMLRLCHLGPRWLLRPALPKVPEGTATKSAGLNHWSTVRAPSPLPIWLGRPVWYAPTLLLPWVTVKGRPERAA